MVSLFDKDIAGGYPSCLEDGLFGLACLEDGLFGLANINPYAFNGLLDLPPPLLSVLGLLGVMLWLCCVLLYFISPIPFYFI